MEVSQALRGLPWWLSGKESACQCGRHGFNPWDGKILWIRKWQPSPVFSPGKSHGQRAWRAIVHGVARVGHDLVNKQQQVLGTVSTQEECAKYLLNNIKMSE